MLDKHPAGTISKSFRDGTMLVTRDGMPRFSNTQQKQEVSFGRWFSVRVDDKSALFDPYDLSAKFENKKPSYFGYRIAPFASTLKNTQTFSWHDGWLIDHETKKLYINYAQHPSFTKSFTYHGSDLDGAGKIPVFLGLTAPPTGDTTDPYKMLAIQGLFAFAVGRYAVACLHDDSSVLLNGIAERQEIRARLCGPKISAVTTDSTGFVELRQLVFTPPSWHEVSSGWFMRVAQVTLAKVAPFLTADQSIELVDKTVLSLASTGSSAGTSSSGGAIPNVQMWAIGAPQMGLAPSTSLFRGIVAYPISGFITGAALTEIVRTYNRSSWHGSTNDAGVVFGLPFAAVGSNTLTLDAGTEAVKIVQDTLYSGAINSYQEVGVSNSVQDGVVLCHFVGPHPQGYNHSYTECVPQLDPILGDVASGAAPQTVSVGVAYDARNQTGMYDITVGGIQMLHIDFSHYEESGSSASVTALPVLDPLLGLNETFRVVDLADGADPWSDPTQYVAAMQFMCDEWIGKTTFYRARYRSMALTDPNQWQVNINPRPSNFVKTLDWTTRDYVVFDQVEGYFIYLKSTFTARMDVTGMTNTLTVTVEVDTPAGNVSAPLFAGTIPIGSMLDYPTWKLNGSVDFIPTHAPRLFFCPMAFEQGSFPGIAHTTASETGADPAMLIDFEIMLVEDDAEDGTALPKSLFRFAPRNLIEMLYAYIYSTTKYGQDNTERYPVDYNGRYDFVMQNAFKQWRVMVRDGVANAWPSGLEPPFGNVSAKVIGRV